MVGAQSATHAIGNRISMMNIYTSHTRGNGVRKSPSRTMLWQTKFILFSVFSSQTNPRSRTLKSRINTDWILIKTNICEKNHWRLALNTRHGGTGSRANCAVYRILLFQFSPLWLNSVRQDCYRFCLRLFPKQPHQTDWRFIWVNQYIAGTMALGG